LTCVKDGAARRRRLRSGPKAQRGEPELGVDAMTAKQNAERTAAAAEAAPSPAAPNPDEVLLRYTGAVPRYTSYPTAVHFNAAIGADEYRSWLGGLETDSPLSLYFHVPFCRSLCWFCGCQTTVARDKAVIASYASLLRTELAMTRAAIPAR